MPLIAKIEAGNRMCDPRRTPICQRNVQPSQIRKIEGPRFPLAVVVELRPIIAVADVVDSYTIAGDLGPGCFSHVGLPITCARRLERQPPSQNENKSSERDQKCKSTIEQSTCGDPNQIDRGGWLAKRGRGQVKIQRCCRPKREHHHDQGPDAYTCLVQPLSS